MNKPSKERIERAAQIHREVCMVGAGIENREETVTAILTADDSAAWQIAEKLAGALEKVKEQLHGEHAHAQAWIYIEPGIDEALAAYGEARK